MVYDILTVSLEISFSLINCRVTVANGGETVFQQGQIIAIKAGPFK